MSADRVDPQQNCLSPGSLDEHQSKRLLEAYGVPVTAERAVHGVEEAVRAAEEIGYPVVLKGAGRALQHKTERNLVHLPLAGPTAVEAAARAIEEEAGDELEFLLVQELISGTRELMAGFYRDEHFGPVLLFGLGGVLAEAIGDTALALAPLDPREAERMIRSIQARGLLQEFRGEAKVAGGELEGVLLGLSRLVEEHPEIMEVDINPLKITPAGRVVAVDALVVAGVPRASRPRTALPGKSILSMFNPSSVAFVGASATMGKWGYLLVVNTIAGGFGGKIHLVNPKGGSILGRKAYRSLEEVPGDVDLAVVTVPARHVLDIVDQCRAKGTRHMLLISSGFAETGSEGKELEANLVEKAHDADLVVLGPNTMGLSNPHARFFCTGSTVTPKAGTTVMVSQSGNLGTQLLAFAEQQGLAIRAFAGSGNEAMVSVEDLLDAFGDDDLTRTILLYVESVKDGRRFFESARRISAGKPIVLLKGGRSSVGHKAAASHTGALATDERVFDAMCRQAGIIKVEQPMELLDLAAAFSSLPLPRGPRVAIMTWGGGWGVVTADLCERNGLEVPALDEALTARIDEILPPYWNRMNPVDLVGEQDPTVPNRVLEALASWDGCDAVMCLGILGRKLFMSSLGSAATKADPSVDEDRISQVKAFVDHFESTHVSHSVEMMVRHEKPVIGVSLLADGQSKLIREVSGSPFQGVFYNTPEGAVKALAGMVSYRDQIVDGS